MASQRLYQSEVLFRDLGRGQTELNGKGTQLGGREHNKCWTAWQKIWGCRRQVRAGGNCGPETSAGRRQLRAGDNCGKDDSRHLPPLQCARFLAMRWRNKRVLLPKAQRFLARRQLRLEDSQHRPFVSQALAGARAKPSVIFQHLWFVQLKKFARTSLRLNASTRVSRSRISTAPAARKSPAPSPKP